MDEQDKKARTRLRAYHLWEKEGRPHGRHLHHWLEAEHHEQRDAADPANEGEGNRTAARAFNAAQTDFAQSAPVERQARAAKKAVEGAEGKALKRAARTGRSRSRGEDPEIKH